MTYIAFRYEIMVNKDCFHNFWLRKKFIYGKLKYL